jgi:hypothetical protein
VDHEAGKSLIYDICIMCQSLRSRTLLHIFLAIKIDRSPNSLNRVGILGWSRVSELATPQAATFIHLLIDTATSGESCHLGEPNGLFVRCLLMRISCQVAMGGAASAWQAHDTVLSTLPSLARSVTGASQKLCSQVAFSGQVAIGGLAPGCRASVQDPLASVLAAEHGHPHTAEEFH